MSPTPPSRSAMQAILFVLVFVVVVCAGIGMNKVGYYAVAIAFRHNPLKLTATSAEGERVSRERGDAIVAAIEQYYKDNTAYPSTLADLVPKYLASISPPVVGRCQWEYRLDAKHGYVLRFFVGPNYEDDT